MKLKPIKTLYDYKEAQKYLKSIFHSDLTEEESNDIEILSVLMENFERRGEPIKEEIIIEPLIDYIYDMIKSVSKQERMNLIARCLKLGEEFGELSAEVLKLSGLKNTKDYRDVIKEKILLESTDCLIMIFDIMTYMGFTKDQICNMSEKQINKWLSKIEIK